MTAIFSTTSDSLDRRINIRGTNETRSVRELAEAGARGRRLTQAETIAVCEALRARGPRSPNQFHSGN